jgi:hypothetical protein
MTNEEKLSALLSSINEIETFYDGSIIIRWKSHVAHEVPGHLLNLAEGSSVLKGHQVHFNPGLLQSIQTIDFERLQADLDNGIKNAVKEKKSENSNLLEEPTKTN